MKLLQNDMLNDQEKSIVSTNTRNISNIEEIEILQ